MITEAVNQNVVTFDAPNGVFDENTSATQSTIFCFLLISQLRVWIVFALPYVVFFRCSIPVVAHRLGNVENYARSHQ